MKKRFFTLIELLLVVTIIMILMSILLPALRLVKLTAQKSGCQSNLKQLGAVWHLYLGDYDSMFPPFAGNWAESSRYSWDWFFYPYHGNHWGFRCPGWRKLKITDLDNSDGATWLRDYAINSYLVRDATLTNYVTTRLNNIRRPEAIILISDGYRRQMTPKNGSPSWTYNYASYNYSWARYGCSRHIPGDHDGHHPSGGMNITFGDGHVKYSKYPNSASGDEGYNFWWNLWYKEL